MHYYKVKYEVLFITFYKVVLLVNEDEFSSTASAGLGGTAGGANTLLQIKQRLRQKRRQGAKNLNPSAGYPGFLRVF